MALNQTSILEQYGLAQTVIKAYEAFLKDKILTDESKSELAVQALVGPSISRVESHALVVQNSLGSYKPEKKMSKSTYQDKDDTYWAKFFDNGGWGKQDYDFPHETERKVEDDAEMIKETIEGNNTRNAPYSHVISPAEKLDDLRDTGQLWQPGEKWIADKLGTGFSEHYGEIAGQINKFTKGDLTRDDILNYLSDCIPCADRFKDIWNAKPLDDLLQVLDLDLAKRLSFLDDILALLQNTEILDEICSLARFLDFLCIPDLVAIIAALKALLAKILDSFKISVSGLLWALLGILLYPFIQGLLDLIKKYIDLLLSPLYCILDALMAQMIKIPGTQKSVQALSSWQMKLGEGKEWFTKTVIQAQPNPQGPIDPGGAQTSKGSNVWNKATKRNDPGMKIKDTATPFEDFVSGKTPDPNKQYALLDVLNGALNWMFYYLALAIKTVTDFMLFLERACMELIGADSMQIGMSVDAATNLLRIARVIGMVMIIVRLFQKKALCQGDSIDDQQMDAIIAEYMNNTQGSSGVVRGVVDGKAAFFIQSPEDRQAGIIRDNKGNKIGVIDAEKKVKVNQFDPQSVDNSKKNGKKVVIVDSCIKSVTMGDDAKVQKWLSEIREESNGS